jgi:DNA polymerase-3 subunit gamma/tau
VKEEAGSESGGEAQPAAVTSGPVTFQVVQDRWRDILAATFERDPRAQALLNSGQPLGIKDGKLVIGFASDLLREKMDKGETLEQVSTALEHVLGRPMGVQCVLSKNWDQAEPAPGDPVMENGGMVDTAVRELGAEVSELDSGAGSSAEQGED